MCETVSTITELVEQLDRRFVMTGAMNTNINTTTNAPVVEAHTPGAIGATGNSVLFVGSSGTGMLTVQSGGTLSNSNLTIGQSGDTGTVTVTGAGSTWTTPNGGLTVGNSGTGTLTIADGGTVSSIGGRRELDHLGPFFQFGRDKSAEIRGAENHRYGAELGGP